MSENTLTHTFSAAHTFESHVCVCGLRFWSLAVALSACFLQQWLCCVAVETLRPSVESEDLSCEAIRSSWRVRDRLAASRLSRCWFKHLLLIPAMARCC